MEATALTLLWLLAMLVALAVHAWGWLAWQRCFGPASREPGRGSLDLGVAPAEASKRIASSLAQGNAGVSARIEQADSRSVRALIRPPVTVGRRGVPSVGTGQAARLVCHLDQTMEGTRVEYTIDPSDLTGTYRAWGLAILLLGSTAILAAAVVFPVWVIPAEEGAIRGQTAQVVQLAHFLWPPFLITSQARKLRALTVERVQDFLRNMPYVQG